MMWKFKEYTNQIAALDDAGNSITYSELEQISERFAAICKRELVFNFCKNSIGSLAGYAGMINGRVVPVMLAHELNSDLRNVLLETYTPAFIWAPVEMQEEFNNTTEVFSMYEYVLLKTNYESAYPLFDELALLLTTSGSTGSPKLVRQSYANIHANTESIVEYLALDENERPITTLPMNYTYGLSIINSHLYVGATILLTDKTLMQKEFWEFLKAEKATSFGGVPYTYEMLKKLRYFRMDLPSIKTMTQAGGKLIPELHKEFAEFALANNKNFVVMYGQTEATARMAYLPAKRALEKAGSMGVAIPDGKFSLIDVDGAIIEESDVMGELVYEGANVTLGYAQCQEDLSKGDERHGRLETGDLAKRDKDGFYYIVGRKKRFLKMFGKRVNLDEIDRLIKSQFQDIECATTGVDDKMYIFITEESLASAVRDYIAEKIILNKSAITVKVISEIPKNDAGKTLYIELERYYA